MQKTGIILIAGRPNTGKSTLLNRIVGSRVAIVSPKPQTTRSRIVGVTTRGETQLVFLDTPGLHKAQSKLADRMVKTIMDSAASADMALLLCEPDKLPGPPEKILAERFRAAGMPAICVINKADAVQKSVLLPTIAAYSQLCDFEEIIPISARTGDGVEELIAMLEARAPEAEHIYEDDDMTDQSERTLAAEYLREQFLRHLDREVPHGIAVVTERFEERDDGVIEVDLTVYCEKRTHKGIIIGSHGETLKAAGANARKNLEELLGTQVYMQIWVRVKEDWRNNDYLLASFGF